MTSKKYLFYTTSSFLYHFKAMGEIKLELQSGNAQFGSKSAFFCPVWPWNMMDVLGKQYATSSIPCQALCIISKPWVNLNWSYSPEMLNLGQNQLFFALCDLEIWWMTLKNNRASLLCYIKLCASLQSLRWIQTGVTVGNTQFGLKKNRTFFVPCDLEIWQITLKKNRTPLLCYFKLCASFCSHM